MSGSSAAALLASYARKPTLSYRTFVSSGSASSSYSFASTDIGTAAVDRFIILSVQKAGGTITSITIGGNTPALIGQAGDPALYGISLAAGATATIAITLDSNSRSMGVGVWAAYGLSSIIPVSTMTFTAGATSASGSLKVVGAGFGIFSFQRSFGTSGGSTWTGATERFDSQLNGTPDTPTGADFSSATTINQSVSLTYANSSVRAGFGAAWR